MLHKYWVVTSFLSCFVTSYAYADSRPNILFLLADDQRPDAVGAFGNTYLETPHIDSLVEEGFSFRNTYCMGSQHGAVCQPSRAMMMSGIAFTRLIRRPDGMKLAGVKTLPKMLRDAGYRTFITGKWHNGQAAVTEGFAKGTAIMMGGMSNHEAVPINDLDADGKPMNKRVSSTFSNELFADAVVGFLKNYTSEDPFFAYVSFTSPHDPRQPPLPYREKYYAKNLPLPPNFLPQHPFDNGRLIVRDENLGAWPRTEAMVRDQLAEYYGMITVMDEQIGRILAALEKTGKRDNTLIIFAADHGLAMGSHGLLGKQNVYEHSMGAPMVLSGPGIPKGTTRAFTYLYDLFPTLLERAGVAVPKGVDGRSLVPLYRGETTAIRDSIFLAYEDIQRAVRVGDWKLIRYPKIDHTQLFDLGDDPDEMNNLAGDPAQGERVAMLMTELKRWQKEIGDTAALQVKKPLPKYVDLTGTAREPDRHQPAWIVKKYFDGY
ncbi:MAG: choline-sulfatase [Candidatus Hydrogenedentota bacterium]|nr:MAG: choline-sulfatase [Candidatus Hydrogenedentota bacterium]